MKTVISNCRLIPELSGGFGGTADVAVEDGKILSVTEHDGSKEDFANDRVIDGRGRTLLPGLFDLHAHLNWDYYNGVIRLNDYKLMINSCLSAKRYLDLGFTTIRDMGSPKRLSVHVREAIRKGLFAGPRIISGGMILRPVVSDVPADPYCFLRYVSGVDEYSRAAKEEIGGGADYVKLYAPGNPSELLPEELEAVVRIAHMRKRGVAVHAHDEQAITMCIDAGVDTVEHASRICEADIERLKQDGCRTRIVPTLATLSSEVPTAGFTQEQKIRILKPLLDANAENIGKAYRAGLRMGFGTDLAIEDQLDVPGLEFRMRKDYCGMGAVDMLLQATKYSAEIVGLSDVCGEVRCGLAADLILVDGKPDEDISAMYQKPDVVIVNGEVIINRDNM